MEQIPFRWDIVGSFLRPEKLKKAREQFKQGKITQEALTEVEDEAIIKLIKKEKELGLNAVTDGEFRRRWWHLDFIAGLNGITVYDFETTAFGVNSKAQGTFVSGKLSFTQRHPFLDHFRFTKKYADAEDVVAKQTIPGPNMIFLDSFILSKRYHENPVYASKDHFIQDLIITYQEAIQSFYDAGCRYLQLDDTSWGALFDNHFRNLIQENGYNPDELIQEFGDITEAVLAKKPEDLAVTFHFCKGNFQSRWLYNGSYDKIASRLLAIQAFNGFFLEFDDERSGGFEPLQNIKDQRIVLGLITTKSSALEDKAALKERIKKANHYVPFEQLCLGTQCGFSSTQEGNDLKEEDQWKKIHLLVDTAKDIWQEQSV
ncbi:5-methyltetrahydropteroyltriglutamate--homocysteine S-methyltransferase [Tetragenococcus muriaticus]|uniref:Cobalamin-independent methionine synthase II n=1 Tax=Tetragenococcus muriaticus 3MR10-3 TaxID=1302648 RepID=A0A091CER3_9ENTE|nr:5-methyltetrahydropteroyltriglutamate--homocysteine S-methyltransferase [Tetragenococcus muriaticus]KFN93163.1 cobalamin-independent methionine synthase II [Tetragenococcus muriaticus 3MR10-3]